MNIGKIELSINQIINPIAFYPISIVGIYFCMSLAKMITKIQYINTFMEYIGKNSFHIMTLHFISIKIVDIVYSKIKNINDINIISKFPNSYSDSLWIIYIIIGTCLPILLVFLINNVIKFTKHLKNENKEYEKKILSSEKCLENKIISNEIKFKYPNLK